MNATTAAERSEKPSSWVRIRRAVHRFSDLRFVLLEGASPLGAARVLATREARWNGDVVCFYVLAVSHAVVVGRDEALSELLTCADFAIYRGTLGTPGSHLPVNCSTANATTASLAPGPGNGYFLIVPESANWEGSYGTTSSGADIAPSASACRAAQVLPDASCQ
jgi:hypothetical protein